MPDTTVTANSPTAVPTPFRPPNAARNDPQFDEFAELFAQGYQISAEDLQTWLNAVLSHPWLNRMIQSSLSLFGLPRDWEDDVRQEVAIVLVPTYAAFVPLERFPELAGFMRRVLLGIVRRMARPYRLLSARRGLWLFDEKAVTDSGASSASAFEQLERAELSDILRNRLRRWLTPTEYAVFRCRFENCDSLRAVAARLSMTLSAVRSVEKQLLHKLRAHLPDTY